MRKKILFSLLLTSLSTPLFASKGDHCLAHINELINGDQIDLSFCFNGNAAMARVADFLKKHPEIHQVNLSNNDLTSAGIKQIVTNPNITSLNLSWNHLDAAGIKMLADDTALKELDLSYNQNSISDESAIYLATNNTLTSLNLESNPKITDAGIIPFAKNTSITDLNINLTQFTDQSAIALAQNTHLRSLEIAPFYATLTDAGYTALANSSSITHLSLAGFANPFDGHTNKPGPKALQAFAQNNHLTYLELSAMLMADAKNTLNNQDAFILGQSKSLQTLILTNNNIHAKGIAAIAAIPSLTTLYVDDNPISDEGALAIAANKNIQELGVGSSEKNGGITDLGGQALAQLPHLQKLDILMNSGEQTFSTLAQNNALRELSFSAYDVKDEDLKTIANQPNLTKLSLNVSWINNAGFISIAQSPYLKRLAINDSNLGAGTTFEKVYAAFAQNKTLSILDLSYNCIDNQGADILSQNTSLFALELDGNIIEEEGAEALAKTTAHLNFLGISENQFGDKGIDALRANPNIIHVEAYENVSHDARAQTKLTRIQHEAQRNCRLSPDSIICKSGQRNVYLIKMLHLS